MVVVVKNQPANAGDIKDADWIPGSLHQDDFLEEGMVTHSSILAWKTPWTEEPHGPQCMGLWGRKEWTVLSTDAGKISEICHL